MDESKINEHVLIAAIIADSHLKELYDNQSKYAINGFFDALDIIKEVTKAFYANFIKQIETEGFEWEQFYHELNKDRLYLSQVLSYDDLVIYWSKEWLRQYFINDRQADFIKM